MKKLIGLIAGISLLANVGASSAFELPKRFQDYRENSHCIKSGFGILRMRVFSSTGPYIVSVPVSTSYYDFECDNVIDAVEGYMPLSDKPFIFGFDLNGDGVIKYYESFLDFNENGWDGKDEVPTISLNSQKI